MNGIKIEREQAISEISKGKSRIEAELGNLKANYGKIISLIVESEGEFVDAIKKQIEAEKLTLESLMVMLDEFYLTLEKIEIGFREQDVELASTMGFKN